MIRITGLNKIHNADRPDRVQSLKNVDLQVAAGQLVVIAGRSGSGKTTLLSVIGALARPTSGEVLVAGQAVAKLPDLHASAFRRDTLGFVFQGYNLLEELSVRDNVAVPLVPLNLKAREMDRRVGRALALANIEHKQGRRVRDLSGGEKQRCAIARALVGDPAIVLCDEPTAHLDRENTEQFLAILLQLKALGKTVLVATHDPFFTGCAGVDRVVRLEDGSIAGP